MPVTSKREFTSSLQENVLALLGYDDSHARIVVNLVEPSMFEGDYQLMAERCSDYVHKYGKAPGKAHITDLLSDILDDPDNALRGTFIRMIDQMRSLSEVIDKRFVMDRLNAFVRLQTLKKTTIEVAEKLQSGQEDSIDEVEELWTRILKADRIGFVSGMRMQEVDRLLNHIQNQYTEFYTGVSVLDERRIVPARATADLFIGSTGTGKSWWLVNIGKQALMQRKKVLHVTLEMGEEEVAGRYFQSFLSIGRMTGESYVAEFDRDDSGNVHGMSLVPVKGEYNLVSKTARVELQTFLTVTGGFLSNIVIKRFPTSTLTVRQLEAYLDTLERVEGFIPDILIVDYLGLLYIDQRDYRINLGRSFKELRGICVDRNIALSTAHQANRTGANAQTVDSTDIAEDWSLAGTADQLFTLTSTHMEKLYNLARLYVGKARNERDKFTVAISQNYTLGQFCLDSCLVDDGYWDVLNDLNKSEGNDDDDNHRRRRNKRSDDDEWED